MYYQRTRNTNTRKNTGTRIIRRVIFALILLIIVGFAIYGVRLYLDNQHKIQLENEAQAALLAKEAKKKEPVYITLPGATPVRALVEDYSLTSSIWKLVNKTNPIPLDYVPAPIVIPDIPTATNKSDAERSIRSDIAAPMKSMFDAASTAGYSLMIASGYRSSALQRSYFNSLASALGATVANQSIALPGQSEHQTGLAADISTVSRNCYVSTCFADTNEGIWLANNSYKYGFILRYPKGKESITQYQYEPWHFRYVGIELATAIHQSGLTFDEAWPYLQAADNTLKQNGAI